MGYSNQRYSPLQRIDKRNAARLVPVWNYSLNNSQSQESQPIVYEGTMYVTTHTSTVAIDALTGRQVWKQELEFAGDVAKMACCGLLNRGVAILNGKIYRTTLDSHVIAYDAKTGKQLWKSQAIDYKEGHAMTGAPLIANGVLMAITPDGQKLYVACGRSASVSVIDTEKNTKSADIAVGKLPWGVAIR